jgi:DNA-binding transcriptional regulator YiaG
VTFDASTPPETWPAEAIEALLDRGTFDDWQRLAEEIHRSPWGRVARIVETITTWGELGSVDHLMRSVIEAAREMVSTAGRTRHADRIRTLRQGTGLTLRDFAKLAGTSAARLSAYERGLTSPTTEVVGRIEHAAGIRGNPPQRVKPSDSQQ